MAKTTDIAKEIFQAYEMPPIFSRLLHLSQQDQNHSATAGTLYQVTEYALSEPNSRGRRYSRPNSGVRPINTEKSQYAENAIQYPYGFVFHKNTLVTVSMLCGNLHDTSEAGKAYLEALLADEKIVEVGRAVSSGGEWVNIELSSEGVGEVFGLDGYARGRVVRKAEGYGVAPLVDCPLFILTKDSYFGGCRPDAAPAGWLLPACVLSDPSMKPEAAMPAGSVDAQGWPTLTGAALDYFRAACIVSADCLNRPDSHGNAARMASEQEEYLAAKLAACAEVQG